MAAIDISSPASGGGGGGGNLQLSGGASMTSTLTSVTDTSNTSSPLKLSTTAVQVLSPLRITTSDASGFYLDAEDSATNNRFSIKRDPSSQVVTLDFASNPVGSTTIVGAIRTYVDGVNLSEVMQFREDGTIFGIGTQAANNLVIQQSNDVSNFYVYNSATWGLLTTPPNGLSNTTFNGRIIGTHGGAGNSALALGTIVADTSGSNFNLSIGQSSTITTAQNGLAIGRNTTITNWSNATAIGYGAIAGANYAVAIGDSTALLQIGGNFTPTARTHIRGTGSTGATTSLLVENSVGTEYFAVQDNGTVRIANNQAFRNGTSGGSNYFDMGNIIVRDGNAGPNGSISIGTGSAAVASAMLELSSTTQGFLPPRMTDAQRAAISSPAEGLLVYNTDNHAVAYRDGTNWGYLCGALQNVTGAGGTQNILFASGNIVNLTLNASTTLTFSGHVVGTYIIQVTQGGAGSNTLTYPASVKWSGGTAPTLTTTVGKTDILTFYHDGTNFFGTYSLNY